MKNQLFLFLFAPIMAVAQPRADWIQYIDLKPYDITTDIYQCAEGDFVVCGSSQDRYVAYDLSSDVLIACLNPMGELLWANNYGAANQYDCVNSIIETDQNDFVAAGQSTGQDMNLGVLVIKVDAEGDEIWHNLYPHGAAEVIIELKNGNYLIAGRRAFIRGNVTDNQGMLLCISSDGDSLWRRYYGDENNRWEEFYTMRETEGGVIVAGYKSPSIWAVKVDFEGEVLWEQTYSPRNRQKCYSMVSFGNGNYALTGEMDDSYYLMVINSHGGMEWYRYYELPRYDIYRSRAYGIARHWDGGFAIVGSSGDGPAMLRIDASGDEQWRRIYNNGIYGFSRGSSFGSVVLSADGGFAASGSTWRNGLDGIILKLIPEVSGPIVLDFYPRNPLQDRYSQTLNVLRGDTARFWVRAIDLQNDTIRYRWTLGDSLVGQDSAVILPFPYLGDCRVQCRVSDSLLADSVRWAVKVRDMFLCRRRPEWRDTLLLRGSRVQFSIGLEAGRDIQPDMEWTLDNEAISRDTLAFALFETLGRHRVLCRASGGASVDSAVWTAEARELLVRGWTPRELRTILRRGHPQTFGLDVLAAPGAPLFYVWTMVNRAIGGRAEVGQTPEVTLTFDISGEYEVEGVAYRGEHSEGRRWAVEVRGAVHVYYPAQRAVRLEPWAPTWFEIYPFNPESDSLSYWWMLDEFYISDSSAALVIVTDPGDYRVYAYVRDGSERDTIVWDIRAEYSVIPPLTSPLIDDVQLRVCPNPFNSWAEVQFTLPQFSAVRLEVMDIQGRVVDTIVDANLAAGSYAFNVDGSRFSSGIYFVRLRVGGKAAARKVVMMR